MLITDQPMKLLGVHPTLAAKIGMVLAQMALLGHPMKVGRGLERTGPHSASPDGYGHAVDCWFLGPDPTGIKQPWPLYGAQVRAQGLVWGGDVRKITDCPFTATDLDHAELP